MSGVMLYNWNDLPRESPRRGIERVAFRGDNAMAVLNWIKPDMEPGPHSHPFEQLVFMLQGQTRLHVGDQVFECGPGSMVRVRRTSCTGRSRSATRYASTWTCSRRHGRTICIWWSTSAAKVDGRRARGPLRVRGSLTQLL